MGQFNWLKTATTEVARRSIVDPAVRIARSIDRARHWLDVPSTGSREILPSYWYTADRNFGDMLSPEILRHAWGVTPVRVSARFGGKVVSTGSVLRQAVAGDLVWGSGLIHPDAFDGAGITFLAVRGPRTRKQIRGDVPDTFGDPAILLPQFYTPKPLMRRFDVGIVPHYVDKHIMQAADSEVLAIDVQSKSWRSTVDKICACDVIISSSLHGIVVAEAYGVPAVWVQPSDAIVGGPFKFWDYFEGTGRDVRAADWGIGLSALVSTAVRPSGLDGSSLLGAIPEALR